MVLAPPPVGQALVQSVDILTPVGNNPRLYGQTAAANAFSDVYAMGGEAYSAMTVLAFPSTSIPYEVIREILAGGADIMEQAGAVSAGGHTLEDPELKYGLAVTGYVDPRAYPTNAGLQDGDILILTKPIGTGILTSVLKAKLSSKSSLNSLNSLNSTASISTENTEDAEEIEKIMYRWTCHLNKNAAKVIRNLGIKAATDITGFGLGGHVLEMAEASHKSVYIDSIPLMPKIEEYALAGLIPNGSLVNRKYAEARTLAKCSDIMHSIAFDAQTSGGILMAVPENKVRACVQQLTDLGEQAYIVGRVGAYKENFLVLE